MRHIDFRKNACVAFATGFAALTLGATSLQATVINDGSSSNFRDARYNAPINFPADIRDDSLVVSLGLIDDQTGLRPEGALAAIRNTVTGETFALNPSGGTSTNFSTTVGYTAERAAGEWQVNVQSNSGTSFFTIPAYGVGPGTQALPGLENVAVTGAGVNRVINWDLPTDLASQNDGNVDRLRVRVRDSNNDVILDQRLPSDTSLSTTQFALPSNVITHNGLYQAEALVEGFNPFSRSTTYENFRVEDVGPGGVQVEPTSQSSFRDNRGENSVNFSSGDRLSLVINVDATVADTTYVDAVLNGIPMMLSRADDIPTEFNRSFDYDPTLTGVWDISIYNGAEKNVVQSRAVADTESIDLVRNLSLTPGELTPTLNWTLPEDSSNIERIQIGLFDDVTNDRILIGSTGGLFQSLDPTATSFTFEEGILEAGKSYVARVILEELDDNNASISRSLSFVNFTPILNDTGGTPVFLPTVDGQGTFNFDFDVTADTVLRLDPFVAVGYEFATGDGDPNFRSVMLPVVGSDDEFLLQLFDDEGNLIIEQVLFADVEFFFDDLDGIFGGVDAFTILGIDPAEGLDPGDVTAFVTSVSFVADGRFTGTMKPITVFVDPDTNASVPEPGALALFGIGLAGLFWARRRARK